MITVGIIGAGFIGSIHAEAYCKIENAKLLAISDTNPKSAEIADSYNIDFYINAEEMIANKDIDIVNGDLILHENGVLKMQFYGAVLSCFQIVC
jgi:UDP-N-acetylglucosamine 3-dehydrogenase